MQNLYEIGRSLLKLVLGKGTMRSYAHFGEDAVLSSMLRGKKDGTYVDVGAYHPILYSNTFTFYKRGWNGLVIDPNPAMAPLFGFFRPRDRFVNVAVGEEGSLPYYLYEDGAYNSLDPAQVERLEKNKGVKPYATAGIPIRPLASILRENNISHIDLLSVDVEGMDLKVLEGHDWSILPTVIAVEDGNFVAATPDASPVYRYLISKGYQLKGLVGLTLLFG